MSIIIDDRKSIVMNKKAGIFAVAGRAKEAIAKFGKDKVINSTLGNGMDEDGKPFILPTYLKTMQQLIEENGDLLCGYTPPGGLPELKNVYPEYILRGIKLSDDTHIRAIPTHGGTGAIFLAIINMASNTVISHLPYWPNYNLIIKQAGKKVAGFYLLDESLNFNISSFEETVTKIAHEDGRIFMLINSPYSNPTGASINKSEWLQMAQILKKLNVPKTLFLDLAYIDFGPNGKDPKDLEFVPEIMDIDPNLNIILAPSASKSFMAYGWRVGANILLSKNQAEADEWFNVMEGTTRATNSNNVTAPQRALAKILSDENLIRSVEEERQNANKIIQERFKIFAENSEKNGIKISKPTGGYFTTVYVPDAASIAEKLEAKNIFTVPIADPPALRISICSLTKKQCEILPGEIKSVL